MLRHAIPGAAAALLMIIKTNTRLEQNVADLDCKISFDIESEGCDKAVNGCRGHFECMTQKLAKPVREQKLAASQCNAASCCHYVRCRYCQSCTDLQ